MSTVYADNNNPVQSLVERKKQQWAREREELAGLNENVPWGSKESLQLYERPYIRSRYASKYQKENEYVRRDSNPGGARRPSLPPLYKNQNFTYTSNEKLDKEMGGETSGYGSDNPNQTPEYLPATHWNLGYESSSSGREDRLKWGDRGVHVGKFWEPKESENMGKNSDTPGWVKRGLEGDTELVVSNSSPAESPEQDFAERPCTGSSTSHNRCYIRGQNVPVDASELAERERKRQIALAHQEAIRQQLEEREKRRQEERARKIREEYEEELRIARERELEKKRQEQEFRIREEKIERERRRKEALKEAIAIAEKEAKEERLKQRLIRQNITENVVQVEKINPNKLLQKEESKESLEECYSLVVEQRSEPEQPNKMENYSLELKPENIVNNIETKNEKNNATSNLNNNHVSLNNSVSVNLGQQISQENLALVLQNPLESLQNVQFAVLIPTLNHSSNPLPIPLATDRSSINTARTENRLLTPTQYRNKRVCDSSTQTDFSDFKHDDIRDKYERDKYVREKLANLEISYESRCRKERRSRSELRENVEDRPKWGVNRPPTRYMKQSEKDPLYQRRKLRQKMRQVKLYDDKSRHYSPHSSDDSQTASPRTYRKKGYTEKRQSRALWRKNEQLFSENVRVYQTEIVPLESDKDHIYYKAKTSQCCCRCKKEKEKYSDQVKVVDILKIEHNSPRECIQYKSELIEDRNKLPDFNNTSIDEGSDVLDKLNSIHHGLVLKHENWDENPRNLILYSPSRHP